MLNKCYIIIFISLLCTLQIQAITLLGSTPFITTWKTDNYSSSGDNQITIPYAGSGYNYTVDWGDGSQSSHTDNATYTYTTPGIYTINITGQFPKIYFSSKGDKEKILTIEQWGNNVWTSMESAFAGCTNLQDNFSYAPDLSQVNNMQGMFSGAEHFNHDISNWDVSNVINMRAMFGDAIMFNQNLNNWDVEQVTSMTSMFESAYTFDQDIGSWTIAKVSSKENMFLGESLSTDHYDSLLIQWSNLWSTFNLTTNVNFHAGNSKFCSGANAKLKLKNRAYCTITDAYQINAPSVNGKTNRIVSGSFTLPDITGFNLTGNEKYYTAPNGSGTVFLPDKTLYYDTFPSYPVTLYFYDGFEHGCKSEKQSQLTIKGPPLCTALTTPLDGDTDIPVNTILSWTRASNATGYKITLGTAPGGNDILDAIDVGNTTIYHATNKLPENTTIFVMIIPYDATGDALNCNEESFTTGPDIPPPPCTTLIEPTTGMNDVPIRPLLSWLPANTASGYLLSIGTNPGATNILNNEDVGNVTSYTPSKDLPNGTIIYIKITPYNLAGTSTGCVETAFTTGATNLRPICSTLTVPLPSAQFVSVDTDLEWETVPNADGYIITLETFTKGIDILNQFDVGNTTYYNIPGDLPENTTIYVTITPYNRYGETEDCTEQTFTTGEQGVHIPPKFFTPNNDGVNDFWVTPNPINRISYVMIYDRYGKLLKQIKNIDRGWDGTFKGQSMPASDYWYRIVYNDGKSFSGHFSLVR